MAPSFHNGVIYFLGLVAQVAKSTNAENGSSGYIDLYLMLLLLRSTALVRVEYRVAGSPQNCLLL